jgi:Ricin-type beta-trefoil lectin domain
MHRLRNSFTITFILMSALLWAGPGIPQPPAPRPPEPAETFSGTAKVIVDETGAIANVYGTFQAAQALAIAFGLIDDPNQDILKQLQDLHTQIDQVAGQIIWHMDETARETRLTDLNSNVHTVRDALTHAQPVDWFDLDTTTSEKVDEGAIPDAFKRHYRDSDTDGPLGEGNLRWKDVIGYTRDDLHYDNNDGTVYDWRLGVPALSQLVALRLMLMGMEDPHFTSNGRFHETLMDFHDALTSQITTMSSGVRCNVLWVTSVGNNAPNLGYLYWVSCADIYSGLNETHQLSFSTDPERFHEPFPDYNTWYRAIIQPVQDTAYRHVRSETPVFGVQALADTLYLYANFQVDLTETRRRIPANADPSLCLDVIPLVSSHGAPVWSGAITLLSPCSAVDSQRWTYNRYMQTIVHVTSGQCLDSVWSGDDYPALLRYCNGGDSQRWTYDPQSHVLFNGRGVALDIRGGNIAAGTSVQTYPRNDGPSQQWLADPFAEFTASEFVPLKSIAW